MCLSHTKFWNFNLPKTLSTHPTWKTRWPQKKSDLKKRGTQYNYKLTQSITWIKKEKRYETDLGCPWAPLCILGGRLRVLGNPQTSPPHMGPGSGTPSTKYRISDLFIYLGLHFHVFVLFHSIWFFIFWVSVLLTYHWHPGHAARPGPVDPRPGHVPPRPGHALAPDCFSGILQGKHRKDVLCCFIIFYFLLQWVSYSIYFSFSFFSSFFWTQILKGTMQPNMYTPPLRSSQASSSAWEADWLLSISARRKFYKQIYYFIYFLLFCV